MRAIIVSLFCFFLPAGSIYAADPPAVVKPDDIFQSHMVLQQNMPINIWGTGDPGVEVKVSLGKRQQKTIITANGKWQVVFPSLTTSKMPLQLDINGNVFDDILVGEVWFCSGQSNMVRNLQSVQPEALKSADYPYLRLMNYNHDGVPLIAKTGLSDEQLARCNTTSFFKGEWKLSNEQSAATFPAVAWFFGRELFQKMDVPVGIIKVAVGGSAINNWISPAALRSAAITKDIFDKDWFSNNEVDNGHRQRGKEAFQKVWKEGESWWPGKMNYRWMCEPGFLFEAGIEHLAPLSFKGVIWYQGETDAITEESTQRYAQLFPMLINNWRDHFGRPGMPFLFVQLPGYRKETWPAMRAIQEEVANEVAGTAMVVTIDLGLKENVHPLDKQPVGERLYLLAKHFVYDGKKKKIFPEFKKVEHGNDAIVVKIDPGMANMKTVTGEVPGFEIADAAGLYRPAHAVMIADNKIEIGLEGTKAAAIRYAWQPFPEPALQLFNEAGLPAGPWKYEIK